MNDWTPGDGWHEVTIDDASDQTEWVSARHGDTFRYWVRESSVPPLPTEPGYYRAEAPQYGGTVVVELLNSPAGQWVDSGDREYLTHKDVRALGPLVLLEPRAVTANRIAEFFEAEAHNATADNWCNRAARTIRREFGVSS